MELTSEESLTGWRREFCVQLLGEGEGRLYVRAVESPSMKADELGQAILLHRVGTAFADLEGCVAALESAAGGERPNQLGVVQAARQMHVVDGALDDCDAHAVSPLRRGAPRTRRPNVSPSVPALGSVIRRARSKLPAEHARRRREDLRRTATAH